MTNVLNQNHPFVIGISGIAGAGKSTLVKHLSKILDATTLFFDDFDEISQGPEDYVKWYESSRNYDDWVYDDLVATLESLKAGRVVTCPATKKELRPTKFVLFDAPLGFCHKATAKYIDFLVCLDTPLDIALARRLVRDYQSAHNPEKILEELEHYLFSSRPLFVLTPEEKVCDLTIDGSLTVNEQCQRVLAALQNVEQIKKITAFEIKLQSLSNDFKRQIYDGFSRHAIAKIGHDEKFDPVAFIASNEKSSFIGAVVIELFWGALHVKYVYVEDEYRGCGIATKLMEQALSYGRDNQCPFAFVETMSFQALSFYQKMGFVLEFTRSGYKHGTSFHYLSKNL
jgi:uridine kinase